MNEKQLTRLFERAQSSAAAHTDEVKKRHTIELALAEFDAKGEKKSSSFQGFTRWFRPTGNSTQPEDRKVTRSKQYWQWGGLSTAAAAAFAVLFLNVRPAPVSVDDVFDGIVDGIVEPAAVQEEHALVPSAKRSVRINEGEETEITVSGFRKSVEQAAELRRDGKEYSDIFSEDIGRSTDSNIAEALSRVAGVSIEANQGRAIRSRSSEAKHLYSKPIADTEPVQAPREYRDDFEHKATNPIVRVSEIPVSTFSIDVDTASYSYVRRQLSSGKLPEKDAVRIEEMLNYFDYDYPLPSDRKKPFEPSVSVIDSPFFKGKKLLHIGIKGYDVPKNRYPKTNLVFLLDVSGSMNRADKLPLVKQSMGLLLSQLQEEDTVAIVVYAGAAGTILEPTQVKEKAKILAALNTLNAGGSTAGAQGIELAYQLAQLNYNKDAVNRIILATDGDFNVGINDRKQLQDFVERKRDKGIYLSVLGFGQGNYQDHLMQSLAQHGNGIAAYIDTLSEAQKVLVDEATSNLFPIANDVKIQVEFNPNTVSEYRLLGYETRALKREDFNNDKVDAGDIGAGHTVTAIYEFTPLASGIDSVEPLRYGKTNGTSKKQVSPVDKKEYAFVNIRYKLPGETASKRIEKPVPSKNTLASTSTKYADDLAFSTAVAGFAQLLKDDKYLQSWGYPEALALAQKHKGEDLYGYRTEFVQLIRIATVAKQ